MILKYSVQIYFLYFTFTSLEINQVSLIVLYISSNLDDKFCLISFKSDGSHSITDPQT